MVLQQVTVRQGAIYSPSWWINASKHKKPLPFQFAMLYEQQYFTMTEWVSGPIQGVNMLFITRPLMALLLVSLSAPVFSQSNLDIQFGDDRLSVKTRNVSAAELASELSEELDISVVVTGDAQTPVNLDIVEEPLEKALSKISENHMLVRDADSQEIVELVLMMAESEGNSSSSSSEQFLPSGSPVEAVVEGSSAGSAAAEQGIENTQIVSNSSEEGGDDGNIPADQVPPMLADEQNIDPNTGLPVEQ